MSLDPAPNWPIEPTTLYFVAYYPTNGSGQSPSYVDPNMYNINDATQRAKDLIIQAANVGVCTITPITCLVVYPSIPWSDF